LIHFFSALFRIYFSSGFSMLIVFYGFVLHFYGARIFQKIIFPLFFLGFMVPLPLVVIIALSFQLKIFAAKIAATMLKLIGFYVQQEGSILKMRNAYVVVDDVCSGLRSLISLTALGSIFAYWLKGPMWKRLLLFATTIPIAVITNVCRVIILASISEIWGPEYAEGFVHDATGFLVFVLAFLMLYVVGRMLE
ncbi:MAG: exosortase/archaeosortase family protein, partial [Candidatus Omnitrophica bacterium]|nr:exosortase/archaeosortase family protein [Candidatus Omnitrophota bacterium]